MAIKSADQISIVDVTDAYSVMLTSESYTFLGGIFAAKEGSCTTQVIALCGANPVPAAVYLNEITKPNGVSVTSDNHAISPTLTITMSTSVTTAGTVKIPVHVGDSITIVKEFSFGIAFTGATGEKGDNGTSVTVTDTDVTYAVSDDATEPTSGWFNTIPTVDEGKYLWTKTVVTYSDGSSTTAYSYSKQGEKGDKGDTGTSVTVADTDVTYGTSTSSSTQPTSWSSIMPTVDEGNYLWTKTVVTYSDGKSTTTYSYSKQGEKGDKGDTGDAGADAITMTVTSSNGTIFKNSAIATVLTAHIYRAGVELNSSQIAELGDVKWYKDGGEIPVGTGITLEIDAGDVTNKATYIAQLEG